MWPFNRNTMHQYRNDADWWFKTKRSTQLLKDFAILIDQSLITAAPLKSSCPQTRCNGTRFISGESLLKWPLRLISFISYPCRIFSPSKLEKNLIPARKNPPSDSLDRTFKNIKNDRMFLYPCKHKDSGLWKDNYKLLIIFQAEITKTGLNTEIQSLVVKTITGEKYIVITFTEKYFIFIFILSIGVVAYYSWVTIESKNNTCLFNIPVIYNIS